MSIKETVAIEITSDTGKAVSSVNELKEALKKTNQQTEELRNQRIDDAARTVTALSAAYGGLQGALELTGLAGEDTMKQLAKIQSALAIGDAIQNMVEFRKAISSTFDFLRTSAIKSFEAIKGAIGATGIGLLVVALGTIYAYWDDIKEAVSGISDESLKQNEILKTNVKLEKDKLDHLSDQDNILKLQGKSEKDILTEKLKQYDIVIKSTEAQIQGEISIQNQREANSKRNFEITKNIIRGAMEIGTSALRLLSAPIDAVLGVANKVSDTLGFGKIVSEDLNDKITKLNEGVSSYASSFIFDPEKVKKDGQEANVEALKNLNKLKNDRAGVLLSIQKIDKDANKESKKETEKNTDEIKQANEKANQDILKLQQENTLARISDERKRAELKLEIDLESAKKDVENSKASSSLKAKEIQALEEKYMLDLKALKAKNAEEDIKKAKEDADKLIKAEKETFDLVTQARLSQIKDANVKRQEEEAIRYQSEIDNLYNALNNKEITEADFNARREALKTLHEGKLTEIEKQNAEERKKTAEAEYQAKVALWGQTGNALNQLSDVIGKSTGVGKALAVAQIAIDTGVAISALTRNSQANPANAPTGGIAGAIQFATGIIQIMANIKKAKEILSSAKVPGGGGGGGGPMPSISATAPVAPQMSNTALNQQMINQQGNATTRAFVLESDVSGNQERIRRLNRAARIN